MNIFDIIGPVMIGPSSSHTAGVVRIGNIIRKILGSTPKSIEIKFHGSFATTYKGHGSDKAIIGGLLGFETDDARIRDSLDIAADQGIAFSFDITQLKDAHPNSILVTVTDENGQQLTVLGESVGGGNIIIRRIDGINVEITGDYDTLIVNHSDAPGAIALVTNVLAVKQINIAAMKVFRSAKGADSIMVIETDGLPDKSLRDSLIHLPNINKATIISGGNHNNDTI